MIIVTGASGFIASNLVTELNRQGQYDIVAVDDYPWLRGTRYLTSDASRARYSALMTVSGYLDLHHLEAWLECDGSEVSGIFHLGACSDTTVTDRDWIMANNFAYTQTLWRWCTKARRPLVYASSAATYGDGSQGYDDRCAPVHYRPLNLYGESKHMFDLWALRQTKSPPRWAGLKYFNVYGPREAHKGRMASVVFHGFQQVSAHGAMQLFRSHRAGIQDGGQQRDFVFVHDVVRATRHFLMPSVDYENGLYNVGTGGARSFNELAHAVFSALQRPVRIDYIPMPRDLQGRYQYFTEACICKLRSAGFGEPMTSLEDGVRSYVQNHLLPASVAA